MMGLLDVVGIILGDTGWGGNLVDLGIVVGLPDFWGMGLLKVCNAEDVGFCVAAGFHPRA